MVFVSTWTGERVVELLALWAAGNSASQIGARLGCSRSAVIGKLHRLGAPPPPLKLHVVKNRIYSRQLADVSRAKARIRDQRYRQKRQREARAVIRSNGASPYSAAYRRHLPELPDMSKNALRAMLATALQNTAAL